MTTLVVIAGAWVLVALAAAFWVGAAMRRADQGERLRLERQLDDERHWLSPDDTDRSDQGRRHLA